MMLRTRCCSYFVGSSAFLLTAPQQRMPYGSTDKTYVLAMEYYQSPPRYLSLEQEESVLEIVT